MNQCMLVGKIKDMKTLSDNNFVLLKVREQEIQIELSEELIQNIKNEDCDQLALKCSFTTNEQGDVHLDIDHYCLLDEQEFKDHTGMNHAIVMGVSEEFDGQTLKIHTGKEMASIPVTSRFANEMDHLKESSCFVAIGGSIYFDHEANANRMQIEKLDTFQVEMRMAQEPVQEMELS